jgi:hypothetical protein
MAGMQRVEAAWQCDDAGGGVAVLAEGVDGDVRDVEQAVNSDGDAQNIAGRGVEQGLRGVWGRMGA